MDAKVSLVVPVYNVEEYVAECLESLIHQTLREIEIVVINDGSPDGSAAICHRFAQEDTRIRVIDQENAGLSAARNRGIQESTGAYILFVDSDDFLEPDACEHLYAAAQKHNLDVCRGDLYRPEPGGEKKRISPAIPERLQNQVLSGRTFFSETVKAGIYQPFAWLNLYKRAFLLAHELAFVPGMYYEDQEWSISVFVASDPRMMVLPLEFYAYRFRESSITGHARLKNVTDLLHVMEGILTRLKTGNFDPHTRQALRRSLSRPFNVAAHFYPRLTKADRRSARRALTLRLRWQGMIHAEKRGKTPITNTLFALSPRLGGWLIGKLQSQ